MAAYPIEYIWRVNYRLRLAGYYLTARNRGDYVKLLIDSLSSQHIDQLDMIDINNRIKNVIKYEIYRKHLQLMTARRCLHKSNHPITVFIINQYIIRSKKTLREYLSINAWQRSAPNTTRPSIFNTIQLPKVIIFIKRTLQHDWVKHVCRFMFYLIPCILINYYLLTHHTSIQMTSIGVLLSYFILLWIYSMMKHGIYKTFYVDLT